MSLNDDAVAPLGDSDIAKARRTQAFGQCGTPIGLAMDKALMASRCLLEHLFSHLGNLNGYKEMFREQVILPRFVDDAQ